MPSINAAQALNARQLAVVLPAISLGSVVMLFLAGRFVGRLRVRRVTLFAGWTFCMALMISLRLPGLAPLVVAILLLGAGEGLYDVAINDEGTTLELLSGRAMVGGSHGMFSLGAMLGTASASAMIGASVPTARTG